VLSKRKIALVHHYVMFKETIKGKWKSFLD